MAQENLDGIRLDLYSRKDGLVFQSDLGKNQVEIKGLNNGDSFKAGDYKVSFEDTEGNVSNTVDVPEFTVGATSSSAPASSASGALASGSLAKSGAPTSAKPGDH